MDGSIDQTEYDNAKALRQWRMRKLAAGKYRNQRLGCVQDIVLEMTDDENDWLIKNAGEMKMTIAEFLVLIVRDAYAEDHDDGE